VFSAEDAVQAMEMCRQQGFDAILMDMHLPGMSGAELSRRIRAETDNLNVNTPIVALTASVAPEDIRHYLDSGMDAVVAKPIRLDKLRETLHAVLHSRPDAAPAPSPTQGRGLDPRLLSTHAAVSRSAPAGLAGAAGGAGRKLYGATERGAATRGSVRGRGARAQACRQLRAARPG